METLAFLEWTMMPWVDGCSWLPRTKKPDGLRRPAEVALQEGGGDLRRAYFSETTSESGGCCSWEPVQAPAILSQLVIQDEPLSLPQRAFLADAAESLAAFRLLRVRSPTCSAVFCATPRISWLVA